MAISAKANYGVRAVAFLAAKSEELSQIGDISSSENIPLKFLEQILLELKRAGVVRSKRGIGGGYSLAVAPEKLSVGQVIKIFDGTLGPVGGLERMRSGEALTDGERSLSATWLKATEALEKILDGTNFAQIAAEYRDGSALAVQTVSHGTAWF